MATPPADYAPFFFAMMLQLRSSCLMLRFSPLIFIIACHAALVYASLITPYVADVRTPSFKARHYATAVSLSPRMLFYTPCATPIRCCCRCRYAAGIQLPLRVAEVTPCRLPGAPYAHARCRCHYATICCYAAAPRYAAAACPMFCCRMPYAITPSLLLTYRHDCLMTALPREMLSAADTRLRQLCRFFRRCALMRCSHLRCTLDGSALRRRRHTMLRCRRSLPPALLDAARCYCHAISPPPLIIRHFDAAILFSPPCCRCHDAVFISCFRCLMPLFAIRCFISPYAMLMLL